MAPPKYDDLGKKISDLFKGFDSGKTVLTLKSKTASGTALKVKGTRSNAKGTIDGEIESSGTYSGLDWTEKWNTSNEVTTELAKKDLLSKGTKFVGEAKFSPKSGLVGSTIKADYKNDTFFVTSKLSNLKNLTATASVRCCSTFFAGLKCDVKNSELSSYEAKAAYVDSDFFVTSTVTSAKKISGSIYHTPQSNIEAGVKFEYDRPGDKAPTFALAGGYKFDSSSELKTSIDNNLSLGLAYKQTLRKGVQAGWFATINAQKLSEDAHKFGASLELSN